MSKISVLSRLLGLAVLSAALHACSDSTPAGPETEGIERWVDVVCESPEPAEALQFQFTSPIPQDIDPLRDPADTTEIFFTVMLPERCPEETFPMIMQSHGYGGSRRRELAADGTLYPEDPGLTAVDELTTAMAYHNYVVVSIDQRGHGESQPRNDGGYARLNSPDIEIEDLRALLDWLYDHADELHIWRQDNTGIAKDMKVGTLGYSYGGAYQMALAALDKRIDTIVPIATWHSLLYSLAASEAIKQNWIGLLCLFAVVPSDGALIGTINTPAINTMCNQAGTRNLTSLRVRTYDDLMERISADYASPRPVDEGEFVGLLDQGMRYFKTQQEAGLPWGYGETSAKLRPVPALVMQGTRDGLFNLTEAYLNWRYFKEAGADARLMTMESGHVSPFVGQVDGSGNCGGVQGVYAIKAWYNHYLKGWSEDTFKNIPTICLSVQSSVNSPAGEEVGVGLNKMPIGSLTGKGALTVYAEEVSVEIHALAAGPTFVSLATIPEDGYVAAGIPTMSSVNIEAGALAAHDAIGIIGVAFKRNGRLYLIDDQVGGFVEGYRTTNQFIGQGDAVMLPGIGETLEAGDEIGLAIYEQQAQFQTLLSPTTLNVLVPGALIGYLAGKPLPDLLTLILAPVVDSVTNPNPYTATLTDVQIPVFKPGTYAGSSWIDEDAVVE